MIEFDPKKRISFEELFCHPLIASNNNKGSMDNQ